MRPLTCFPAVVTAAAMLMHASVAPASAATIELGTTLAGITTTLEDNNTTLFGIPSGSFSLLSPSVYASFFAGSKVAVEPQLGVIWMTTQGESTHLVNAAVQFDYFVQRSDGTSPYVFAAAGVIDMPTPSPTPKLFGGGAGYRLRVGDRLTFRVDGRLMHFTENDGDALMFNLSIGGLLGTR